ncbi:MAG: glycosyl hydrolase family 28-related protein, partial [Calditrichota bacterium]
SVALLSGMGCSDTTTLKDIQPRILRLADTGEVYLPDFSYAGYKNGGPETVDGGTELVVTDYGAVANDSNDDTDAFKAAIQAASRKTGIITIRIPNGRFILSDYLYIERDSLRLKGGGQDETVLYISKALSELPLPPQMAELQEYLVTNNKRVKPSMELFSPFSWTGGFLWIRKPDSRGLAYLKSHDVEPEYKTVRIEAAQRGSKEVRLSQNDSIKNLEWYAGQLIRIDWFNTQGESSELLKHVYLDSIKIGKRHWINSHRPLITQYATLLSVTSGSITIKEPLLHDVRFGWKATIAPADLLREIAIEGMSIEFPDNPYGGHHLEAGYNAIYITDTAHSRIRDIRILNADNAIMSDNAAFVTVEQIEVEGRLGHYAVHLGKTNHFLVKQLHVDAEQVHSISFNTGCKAGVFTDIVINHSPTMDQHCGLNHQNLFDQITLRNIAAKHDIFKHGGAGYWRPTHGAFNTFWNISLEYDLSEVALDTVEIG